LDGLDSTAFLPVDGKAQDANHSDDADLLGGVAASGYQRVIADACPGGQAVTGIDASGVISCQGLTQVGGDGQFLGPLPVLLPTFTMLRQHDLMISFSGTGFRSNTAGPGNVGATLLICKTTVVCSPGNETTSLNTASWATQPLVHQPFVTSFVHVSIPAGDYQVAAYSNPTTQTDGNDRYSYLLLETG
jgi:hypothetical protein